MFGMEAVMAAQGDPAAGNGKRIPDPAVLEKPERRRFTAEYKLRILNQAGFNQAGKPQLALLALNGQRYSAWQLFAARC